MNHNPSNSAALDPLKVWATLCRWTARIVGALLVIFLFLASGEGMPNLFRQPVRVQLGFLALGLLTAGLLAGWRWEVAAGILVLAGWSLFVAAEILPHGRLNWFLVALAVPGILFLASAALRHRQLNRN